MAEHGTSHAAATREARAHAAATRRPHNARPLQQEAVPTPHSLDEATLRFIEDMAFVFERAGHARMPGRILAWLMIADPPYQSAAEIGSALGASKGSVSTNLRFLVERGLVERFTRPPQRRDYYRVTHGMWPEMVRRNTAVIHAERHVAERGLKLLEGVGEERQRPLLEMLDFLRFYEEETDAMLDRWRREHDAKQEGDER
jgi:DNA-binding transcriptional regulator GbsR (MarR family)